MKLKEFCEKVPFEMVNQGDNLETEVGEVYCCDLLSIAMGKLPASGVWITVMANINTLAVAELTDAACIVLAEGALMDSPTIEKAKTMGISVLKTDMTIFKGALLAHEVINDSVNV